MRYTPPATQDEGGIDPIFISVKEAARALALSPWSTYQLLDEQKIDSRYEGRRRLVSVVSLREYAANLPSVPAGQSA
jgi:hypothetical protein